jgi:hypothetical protein
MPIRLARGQLAPWEAPLALLLAIAAIYLLVRLAGRVYTGALLRTGGKVRLRDAWRLGGSGHPVPVPNAGITADEGLEADSQQRHAERQHDRASAGLPR